MIATEKVLVVDVDGTLCPIKGAGEAYADLPPNDALAAQLRVMHGQGWRVVISSARGMRTHDGNVGAINRHVLPVLIDWLDRHAIPYDEIRMGKSWPGHNGFYIDDRTVRPREFLTHTLEELEDLCIRDRFEA